MRKLTCPSSFSGRAGDPKPDILVYRVPIHNHTAILPFSHPTFGEPAPTSAGSLRYPLLLIINIRIYQALSIRQAFSGSLPCTFIFLILHRNPNDTGTTLDYIFAERGTQVRGLGQGHTVGIVWVQSLWPQSWDTILTACGGGYKLDLGGRTSSVGSFASDSVLLPGSPVSPSAKDSGSLQL